MVLDFANEAELVRKAFEPYYESTILSESTDPQILYDLQHDLEAFAIYTEQDVNRFAELFFTNQSQNKLYQALKPVRERALACIIHDDRSLFGIWSFEGDVRFCVVGRAGGWLRVANRGGESLCASEVWAWLSLGRAGRVVAGVF